MAVLKEAAMQGRLRRTLSIRRAASVSWTLAVVMVFGSLFGSLSVDAAAAGQLRSEGSIIGQVTDESGAVLPGVTVTA
jgi:hypothetical protein